MYINELFEAQEPSSVLVIYPGRFQPWHKGHKAVYDHLIRLFGRDNVFIATSNKVDPPRSPFNFAEKTQFMQVTGVSMDRVVETRDPYRAIEIVQNYNPQTTRLIFAVSEKDMDEDPRFKFGYKKDGSPTYLQAMPKNPEEMQAFEHHGYVMTVPTFEFTVLGKPMSSATEVRRQFANANDNTQQAIIKDLFGNYTREIHSLMKNKIELTESINGITESNENPYRRPSTGEIARVSQQTQAKLDPNRNKFIWKKPNQIGGSFTDQQLLGQGFKKSQFNSWGGTQAMWDRLLGIKEQLNADKRRAGIIRALKKGMAEDSLNEFSPTPGRGGENDFLLALASAWYNSTFNTGSLQKGIKSQEDVERLLARGIVCPDGKTRRYNIDYNPSFDGVVIYSDDYYEHSDAGGELDNRTGKPWGPYEFIEYHDNQLYEDAAGVGVIAQNKKMAQDPRYSMSMTKDVKPGQDKKNLRAWRLIK